jgi:hypothetical protein
MDEFSRDFSDETGEAVSGVASATAELRKRRSTRIVQAVPLTVAGVDALGRPFNERTSTLIINCHGCRYQSKHYVLKNMWVTLEVPHPETGQPSRAVRGRVAWIQRPRTVRQLFQVALELELPGNVWGIGFPPEDWFAFPDAAQIALPPAQPALGADRAEPATAPDQESPESHPQGAAEAEFSLALGDADFGGSNGPVRAFPAPASTTDASMQLARQVARLLADARQQIYAAAREAAAQAVSAERRLSADPWEHKIAAAREEFTREVAAAVEKIHEESAAQSRAAQQAAIEALQRDLPRWVAPQLEELTRDLTAQLTQEALILHNSHTEQATESTGKLLQLCSRAQDLADQLGRQASEVDTKLAAATHDHARIAAEAVREMDASVLARREVLASSAAEIQRQVASALSAAQLDWHNHLTGELEAAQLRVQIAMDNAVAKAQSEASASLTENADTLFSQFQQNVDGATLQFREAASATVAESEQRLLGLHDSAQTQAERIESSLRVAGEILGQLEKFSERIESAQQHAFTGFQSQVDDVLTLHRNELHRRSDSLFDELVARIHANFEEAGSQAVAKFEQQVELATQPHLLNVDHAIHRMAGGRSMLDAATSLQQERIRVAADEAFAEALAQFRGNLGGVEQLLRESADAVTARSLADLEGRAESAKHHVVEGLLKSAEWYEKKAQTQIHQLTQKAAEQAEGHLRDRAGEISSAFAGELDHASRNFVGHTQTQMEDVVREAFERARALFSEAAETTSAAFIDEIQRYARQELGGLEAEAQKSVSESRAQMEAARAEIAQKVTVEQEDFLRRFQTAMSGAMEASVAEANQKVQAGFGPLLESWKSMTEAQQAELRKLYAKVGEQAAEHYRGRLENVSNQWMLATVASLDQQSRQAVAGIAANAEEKLRGTCTKVFSEIGDALRERLGQIAANFNAPTPPISH